MDSPHSKGGQMSTHASSSSLVIHTSAEEILPVETDGETGADALVAPQLSFCFTRHSFSAGWVVAQPDFQGASSTAYANPSALATERDVNSHRVVVTPVTGFVC